MSGRALTMMAAVGLLFAAACDGGDDPGPPDTGLADVGPGDDRGVDEGPPDRGPTLDAEVDRGPGPDAAPPAAVGRPLELCVACGAAASPRFRLIEHGLGPVEAGGGRAAESPRFKLVIDP